MELHSTTQPAARVTRVEIAEVLEFAFDDRTPTAGELRAYAEAARPALLAELARLPEGRYPSLRDLWSSLPDVPID